MTLDVVKCMMTVEVCPEYVARAWKAAGFENMRSAGHCP